MSVWPRVAAAIDTDGAAALVSIAGLKGSGPREPGARMVVRCGGGFFGTIGGGALEHAMLIEARAMLMEAVQNPMGRRLRQALGPDLGQCCGGQAIVTVETFNRADMPWIRPLAQAEARGIIHTLARPDARGRLIRRLGGPGERAAADDEQAETFGVAATPLLLFGAGHVGRALALALAPLPFAVDWIDGRADAFPAHAPANARMRHLAEPAAALAGAAPGTLVAIMTHSHPLDLALAALALADERFAYVGLIGSDTKRARFLAQMRKAGLGHDTVERLVCPIGGRRLSDKAPAVIAAAVAVELLEAREALGGP